jgi:hypothetical protein
MSQLLSALVRLSGPGIFGDYVNFEMKIVRGRIC